MYNLAMVEFPIAQARADFQSVISKAKKRPVCITKHGKPDIVMIDPSLYEEMLNDLEELQDLLDAKEAMKHQDEFIPWDKVKKDLGLA